MNRKLIIALLGVVIMATCTWAIPYRLTTLYAHPNQESQVAYYFPEELIKVDVLEVRGDWVKVRIRFNMPLFPSVDAKGWAFVERAIPHKKVAHWNLIHQYADWLGIPANLIAAVQIRETGWLPHTHKAKAVSPVGAIGLQQIMPYWATHYGYKPRDLYDPHINIEISAKILRDLYIKYDKDLDKVFAAYNGGAYQATLANAKRCKETRNYVILGLKVYKELKG